MRNRLLLTCMLLALATSAFLVGCSKHLPTQTGADRVGATFGLEPTTTDGCDLSIGNFVWNDLNGNGVQDGGEPGLPGVTVVLLDVNGNFLREVDTDATGHYAFGGLCPGQYQVYVKEPCPPTKLGGTADQAKDSNPNPTPITLEKSDDTVDFGFRCDGKGDCAKCEGKVTELCLKYNGAAPAYVEVWMKKPKVAVFTGNLEPGQEFCISGADKKGTLGTEIIVYVNGVQHTKIHTSCSQPIGPGLVSKDFEVVSGRSLKGGPLCPLPPVNGEEDLCTTRPRAVRLTYTGLDCSATSHDQDPSKVSCSGDPALAGLVRIVIGSGSTAGSGKIWFDGIVALGADFTMDAANAGETKLSSDSYAFIFADGVLVQSIKFHTSCSQPLRRGDQFGALRLEGIIAP